MNPTFTEFTAGKIVRPMAGRRGPDLTAAGYVRSEWCMSGEAASYDAVRTDEDGRFELEVSDTAPYATRVLVRRPEAGVFSGVVLVEWLNVSGGQDAAPEYTYLAEEILRRGHAWVGITAQYIGVEGGDAAVGLGGDTAGLRNQSPERYGDLHHPGDAFSFDMVTALGRALRDPGPEGPLGDLRPEVVVALGQSQSAMALTSYVNGVHPLGAPFDAYLLHSRSGGYVPFDDRGRATDVTAGLVNGPVRLRDDLDVPVLVVQCEGDLGFPMRSAVARQPDSERVMWWEIAGSAHSDAFQLGEFAPFVDCDGPINNGQQAYVLRAALRHLLAWVAGGDRPPASPRIETDDDGEPRRDEWGTALGGIRPPAVEVPTEVLTGAFAPGTPPLCLLLGRTVEVADEALRTRYAGVDEYLGAYGEATDRATEQGFLLAEDRDELVAEARVERVRDSSSST